MRRASLLRRDRFRRCRRRQAAIPACPRKAGQTGAPRPQSLHIDKRGWAAGHGTGQPRLRFGLLGVRLCVPVDQVIFNTAARHRPDHGSRLTQRHDGPYGARKSPTHAPQWPAARRRPAARQPSKVRSTVTSRFSMGLFRFGGQPAQRLSQHPRQHGQPDRCGSGSSPHRHTARTCALC